MLAVRGKAIANSPGPGQRSKVSGNMNGGGIDDGSSDGSDEGGSRYTCTHRHTVALTNTHAHTDVLSLPLSMTSVNRVESHLLIVHRTSAICFCVIIFMNSLSKFIYGVNPFLDDLFI
jgi:hypothetical protein